MERPNNQDLHANGRPADFAFRFEYHSETMPAVGGYFEFEVEVAPDGSGEIRFRRDIEANHPDEFVSIFQPEEAALQHAYRVMMSVGICEPVWQPPRRKSNPGGSQAWLEVTCGGNCFEITPARYEALEDAGVLLYDSIHTLVPEEIWKKIDG
jgi:hypothetical protein